MHDYHPELYMYDCCQKSTGGLYASEINYRQYRSEVVEDQQTRDAMVLSAREEAYLFSRYRWEEFTVLIGTVGGVDYRHSCKPLLKYDENGCCLDSSQRHQAGVPQRDITIAAFLDRKCVGIMNFTPGDTFGCVRSTVKGSGVLGCLLRFALEENPFPKTRYMTPEMEAASKKAFRRLRRWHTKPSGVWHPWSW